MSKRPRSAGRGDRGSTPAGELRALAIAQVGGQDELIARVLAGRGVEPEAVERYLDPTLARR